MSWTDERKARLIELAAQGLSAAAIATDLGVSKNSVVGKIDRMRGEGVTIELSYVAPRKPRSERKKPKKQVKVHAPLIEEDVPVASPTGFECTIEGLGVPGYDGKCRFIAGDVSILPEDTIYCGARTVRHKCYCPFHYMKVIDIVATQRAKDRAISKATGHHDLTRRQFFARFVGE